MSYAYIKNKEQFEEEYPYDKDRIANYPSVYPCILSVEYKDAGLMGNFYDVYIIEDLSDFIYQDGFLYKKC